MRIIGIDPGKSGGIAFISENEVRVIPMPTRMNAQNKDEIDFKQVSSYIQSLSADCVYIENVHAMPGQGVTSMFNFGYSTGGLHGICESLGLPIIKVNPRTWQKSLMGDEKHDKADTIDYITKQYPDISLLASTRSRKPHDGMADALAIAHFGINN